MTLSGPEKIEISDDQLEALKMTYKDLKNEIEEMIRDFFSPFEIMNNEKIFSGTSANSYTQFCMITQNYTEVRYEMILDEFEKTLKKFEEKINEAESIIK